MKKLSKSVRISVACVYAFIAIGTPLLIRATGLAGLFNYWFIPWLVFHFWVNMHSERVRTVFFFFLDFTAICSLSCEFQFSNVTAINHSSPHIPFKAEDKWSAVQAQFSGTVHCDYPMW